MDEIDSRECTVRVEYLSWNLDDNIFSVNRVDRCKHSGATEPSSQKPLPDTFDRLWCRAAVENFHDFHTDDGVVVGGLYWEYQFEDRQVRLDGSCILYNSSRVEVESKQKNVKLAMYDYNHC